MYDELCIRAIIDFTEVVNIPKREWVRPFHWVPPQMMASLEAGRGWLSSPGGHQVVIRSSVVAGEAWVSQVLWAASQCDVPCGALTQADVFQAGSVSGIYEWPILGRSFSYIFPVLSHVQVAKTVLLPADAGGGCSQSPL